MKLLPAAWPLHLPPRRLPGLPAAPDLPAAVCPTRLMGRVPATAKSGSCCQVGAGKKRTSPTGRGQQLWEQALDLYLCVCV